MTDPNATAFQPTAELYDAVYAAKGKDYRAEAGHLHRIIREHRDDSALTLLDVACGTGEHLAHLRSRYRCEGLDRSPAMLAVARRKLPGVELHEADMTAFDLGRRFDVVTCLFASIAYLPDAAAMRRAVGRMAAHLRPHGLLLIEPGVMPHRLRPPQRSELTAEVGEVKVRRVTDARVDGSSLVIDFDYEVLRPDGAERFRERHTVQLFSQEDYEGALAAAGLRWGFDPEGLTGWGLFIAEPS